MKVTKENKNHLNPTAERMQGKTVCNSCKSELEYESKDVYNCELNVVRLFIICPICNSRINI